MTGIEWRICPFRDILEEYLSGQAACAVSHGPWTGALHTNGAGCMLCAGPNEFLRKENFNGKAHHAVELLAGCDLRRISRGDSDSEQPRSFHRARADEGRR